MRRGGPIVRWDIFSISLSPLRDEANQVNNWCVMTDNHGGCGAVKISKIKQENEKAKHVKREKGKKKEKQKKNKKEKNTKPKTNSV